MSIDAREAHVRRLNALLGAALYVVIIIHVLLGCAMLLTGAYIPVLKLFARAAGVLAAIVFWHAGSLGGVTANGYELFSWDPARLGLSLLFVACLGVHLVTSAPALMLSAGISCGPRAQRAVQCLLGALALACALAFCIYAKVMWA